MSDNQKLNIFGSSSGGPFGKQTEEKKPGGIFGGLGGEKKEGGLFGGKPSTAKTLFSDGHKSGGSFGSKDIKPLGGGGMFSMKKDESNDSGKNSGLFSGASEPSAKGMFLGNSSAAKSPFGGGSNENKPVASGSSIFGNKTGSQPKGGLFGMGKTDEVKKSTGLFASSTRDASGSS
jgi:hypothetical protein